MNPRNHTIFLATSVALILLPGSLYGLDRMNLVGSATLNSLINPVCVIGLLIGYPAFAISFVVWLAIESRQNPVSESRVATMLVAVVIAVIVAFTSTGNFVGEYVAG